MGYKGSKILKKKFGKVAPTDSLKTFYTPDTPLYPLDYQQVTHQIQLSESGQPLLDTAKMWQYDVTR